MLLVLAKLAVTLTLVAAWLRGREAADAATVRRRLRRSLVLSLLLAGALRWLAVVPPGALQGWAAGLSAALAVGLLWPLAHLALAPPWKRGGRTTRAILLGLGAFLLWQDATGPALFFLVLGLLRHPWLAVLDTGERFRVSLTSLAVTLLLLLGTSRGELLVGQSERIAALAWMLRGLVAFYAGFGTPRAFKAFTTDPTLGIRRVSLRLTLSHVLVVLVPVIIIVALWISSTYLGVNADRALVTGRAIDHEGQALQQAAHAALGASDDAVRAASNLREAYRARWPGTLAYAVDGARVTPASSDTAAGAAGLASWVAGLDSLPAHGIVELAGRRWLGGAARDGQRGLVVLAPIGVVLDSTLSPLMGATVTMRRIGSGTASLDSLRQLAGAARDSLADAGSAHDDSVAFERARAVSRAFGVPDSVLTRQRRSREPVLIASGTDTLSGRHGEIGVTGQVQAIGVSDRSGRWRKANFTVTARASFRATLVGLFAKVRENPLQAIPLAALAGLGFLLVPLAITNLRMVTGMGGSITRGIGALRDGARAFGDGRLAHRIEIEGDDDLWDTARQFNQMAEGLERARELEKERDRLETELELARRIQARLLPATAPRIAGLDISGLSESAREVGGDYYDHLDLGGGRVLLVIADVSGKGVPAALLMSGFRASLMSQDTTAGAPDVVAVRLNEFLHRSVEPGRFVTAFLGFLDAASGRFVYVNAGHNPPVLVRADGRVEMLSVGGLILGIMPDSPFASGETTLEPGDLLALYTDGVTEGANAVHEQWGEERLVATLRASAGEAAAVIAARIVREVRAFEGESGPADDITLLIAKRVAAG